MKRYDVFVSYAYKSTSKYVEKLVKELKDLGITVWYDKDCIKCGEKIFDKIEQGIKNSSYSVILFSRKYFMSFGSKKEFDLLKRYVEDEKILPILWQINERKYFCECPLLKEYKYIKAKKDVTQTALEIKERVITQLFRAI